MTSRRAAALPLLLAVAVAAACSDSSGPSAGGFEGRYTLVAANDTALPFVVYTKLTQPPTLLVGGSLTVLSRGRVMDVREFRTGTFTEVDSTTYAYTVEGNRLILHRPRINPAQTHADTGTVAPGGVSMRVRFVVALDNGPRTATLVYQRAP